MAEQPRQRDAYGRFMQTGKRQKAAVETGPPDGTGAALPEPSEAFLAELQTSWTRHGAAMIEQVRVERPHDYLKLMASSLAKQAGGHADPLDGMSDDEVADELRRILDRLDAPGAETGARAGTAKAAELPGEL